MGLFISKNKNSIEKDDNGNKLNGLHKIYKNNQLICFGYFKNGKKNGLSMIFEYDKLLYFGHFNNDEPRGLGIYYNPLYILKGNINTGTIDDCHIYFKDNKTYNGKLIRKLRLPHTDPNNIERSIHIAMEKNRMIKYKSHIDWFDFYKINYFDENTFSLFDSLYFTDNDLVNYKLKI